MKKVIIRIGLIVLILALIAWFGGRWILSFSTATYSGKIELDGIRQPVEITFDSKGIPQIWAESDSDMYFALGWLHASERLFQMELVRRLAGGELSEIFGADLFQMDFQHRRIGFARKAKADLASLENPSLERLQRYCDGVNAWISYKSILPPEFIILGITPRSWKPLDCLSIAIYQTWFAHALMDHDLSYQKLMNAYGDELIPFLNEVKKWSPPTVHNHPLSYLFQNNRFPLQMSEASNSWVVAPSKSTAGAALHASDPHLPINMIPCFWYIVGLHSNEGTDVLGVTIAGVPFVAMGHNGKIAYAFTVAALDIIDYYREQRHPDDSLQVLTPNGYQKMTIITENIRVKGEEQSRNASFMISPRGIVLEADSSSVLSLKWAGIDFAGGSLFSSAFSLHNADNFDDFRRAVTGLGALNVNWTYSDINGNIGYQLGAPIPIREYENTFMQLPGEDAKHDWKGYLELEQTPHAFNPKEGWLATCNNQIVSESRHSALPGFYDPYRIIRAKMHLTQKQQHAPHDFNRMQLDQISAIALRWKELMADGAAKLGEVDLEQRIRHWNGKMSVEEYLPGLFTFWGEFFNQQLFEDNLGADWGAGRTATDIILDHDIPAIIDDLTTADYEENLADISANALKLALVKYGTQVYGDVCQLKFSHLLSQAKVLDYWLNLNRGPFPVGGDNGALNANWRVYDSDKNRFDCIVGPSMRFIMDWSDVDGFTINTALGQSGNPFSPHYDDFLEMWRSGERWIVPFSKEKVYRRKANLLVLTPLAN
ncbi:penicillin acylase family protein [candidate division KSB1 bacterium]|nr:penicillin acylase family protein [candidate division KSB1 bacterium]